MEQLEVETSFTCNGLAVAVNAPADESLLLVLRERLGIVSVKDGCAPQGQCGCCTVLVDGEPRVACVTPIARVAGRSVTTVEGLDGDVRDGLATAFVATGGSQCGFCTPGIVMRASGARVRDLDRALAAHLCRCTGWRTVYDAIAGAAACGARDLDAAARRAELEGGVAQAVRADVPLGGAHFADDTAPRDALVAVPLPPDSEADAVGAVDAAGGRWVVGASLGEARLAAGKVQGRRTTVEERPPLFDAMPPLPAAGVRLATSWVEPAYLEPDASWCEPGGEPASPYVNGGAFGGKLQSAAPAAARELADRFGAVVRVVYSREDVVRLGPKRPPMAASATFVNGSVEIEGVVATGGLSAFACEWPSPYACPVVARWREIDVAGPPVGTDLRASGLAERAVLVEGALDAAGIERASLTDDPSLLDTCVVVPSGASAGARLHLDPLTGALERVEIRVAAGGALDEIVLRSYAIGAAHMALGWVFTESLSIDPETGEVHDLTIRSFGIMRARDTPPVDVVIVDDGRDPRAGSSDAVFAAVAAAAWNAVTRAEGVRPDTFPARQTRAARRLRR